MFYTKIKQKLQKNKTRKLDLIEEINILHEKYFIHKAIDRDLDYIYQSLKNIEIKIKNIIAEENY